MLSEADFIIQDSSIKGAGKGLFAKMDIPKETNIGPYTGRVLTDKQANSSKYCNCKYFVWVCKDHWIMGEGEGSAYTKYINHSEKPNARLITSSRWKKARIESTRKIKAGEEIFITYGDSYWIDEQPIKH